MSSTTQHEVKAAASVLSDDAICQSFIQSSSTLAYACLLIRRKQYDLATHVLHSLEAKQASRFKDMIFYMQTQIGIETGDYGAVKRRLVPRISQHPNDMVALSLLESDIYQEWVTSKIANPQPEPAAFPSAVPDRSAAGSAAADASASVAAAPVTFAESADGDFGIYQTLSVDENTQALGMGNAEQRRFKSTCRDRELEPLVAALPQLLPGSLTAACNALESGEILKVCFSFQNLTITSLRTGPEHLDLVTGNINQSLLTMVRAENLFLKNAASAQARARLASQTVENMP